MHNPHYRLADASLKIRSHIVFSLSFSRRQRLLAAASIWDPARTLLTTNAEYYKFFEYWGFGKGVALSQMVNSGRSLGDNRVDWRTLSLALRSRVVADSDVLVIAADTAPPQGFDVLAVLNAAREKGSSALVTQGGGGATAAAAAATCAAAPACVVTFAYDGVESVSLTTVDLDARAGVVSASRRAFSPIFYAFSAADVGLLLSAEGEAALAACATVPASTLEEVIVPIEAAARVLASRGRLVSVETQKWLRGALDGAPPAPPSTSPPSPFAHALPAALSSALLGDAVHATGHARVGLLGNPSDGYGGKTMSVTIANFRAEAWVTPTPGRTDIVLIPHPVYDPVAVPSLRALSLIAQREGYGGGIRLMSATLNRFHQWFEKRQIALPDARGFTLRYHTTVPRQVGLAGSSAIVTALVRALLRFYGYGDEGAAAAVGLSKDTLPNFVLAIESEELGITAGLQDRVVQSYEGPVHMDFSPDLLASQGHGTYTRVPAAALPPLFLAYAADPSDSGKIHAPIKQRWLSGDVAVIRAMQDIASNADAAKAVATARPYSGALTAASREAIATEWATLFTRNFDGRRALFGDPALGRDNIRMIEIAREVGAAAKLPGSGGAVIGVVDVAGVEAAGWPGIDTRPPPAPATDALASAQTAAANVRVAAAAEALRVAYHKEGYVFIRITPFERGV